MGNGQCSEYSETDQINTKFQMDAHLRKPADGHPWPCWNHKKIWLAGAMLL
jgi:hypothetical protein